jgi:hypothetical protein
MSDQIACVYPSTDGLGGDLEVFRRLIDGQQRNEGMLRRLGAVIGHGILLYHQVTWRCDRKWKSKLVMTRWWKDSPVQPAGREAGRGRSEPDRILLFWVCGRAVLARYVHPFTLKAN